MKVILKSIYKLLGKKLTEEQWAVWLQFVGFAIVGVSQ